MNIHLISPRPFFRQLSACVVCLLISAGFTVAIAAPKPDSCALLKPSDLATLLGGTVVAKGNAGGGCNWTASGSHRKLAAINYRHTGRAAEMAFMGYRQNADKTGKVTDESGIGDKAFSIISGSGLVTMMMIKQGRLLQLMYVTGAPDTVKDLAALRPVATKAIAAF